MTEQRSNSSEADKKKEVSALTECLFSQYYATVASIAGSVGYAAYRKPKNGLAILFVAGAAGSMVDLVYGWLGPCREQSKIFAERRAREFEQSLFPRPNNKDGQTDSDSRPS